MARKYMEQNHMQPIVTPADLERCPGLTLEDRKHFAEQIKRGPASARAVAFALAVADRHRDTDGVAYSLEAIYGEREFERVPINPAAMKKLLDAVLPSSQISTLLGGDAPVDP